MTLSKDLEKVICELKRINEVYDNTLFAPSSLEEIDENSADLEPELNRMPLALDKLKKHKTKNAEELVDLFMEVYVDLTYIIDNVSETKEFLVSSFSNMEDVYKEETDKNLGE
jgi:predicted  nucleic acid-binding Zn-ribbon protein